MLKFQIALIAILIISVTFISCDRAQKMLEPAADDIVAADDMPTDMMKMMDLTMYMSWAHVPLPAPPTEVTNPGESGIAHGMGTRTVYFNDLGATANMEGTMYPAGTAIVKTIMDDANTFVAKKAVMMKTDDPMYANHNGWVYSKYARSSEDAEYMQVRGSNLADAGNGCHGCHAKAGTEGAAGHDSVFVSLSMDNMTDMPMHKSWAHVTLPEPVGTGTAHGTGARTVYFNEASATANMARTAYPAGTVVVKESMDATNTFVMSVVTMTKTDAPMYAEHNGWIYGATQRQSEADELMMPQTVPMAVAASCHGCHAKAENDSVFVSLSMDETPETPGMPDAGNGTDADGTGDDAGDVNGAGDGNGANDAGTGDVQ